MAKNLQIRDVPEDVHRELRARAAAAGVSLSAYALEELMRVTQRPPISEVLARAMSRHGGADRDAIVAAVRAGRDQ